MKNRAKPNAFIFSAALLTIAIFIEDTLTPRGVTEGFLYMIVVMLTLWIPGKRCTMITANSGAILTIIGYYFSPPALSNSISLTNRFFAILGIYITMYVVLKNKEKERMMKIQNEELEKLVNELKISNFELEQYAYVASHDLQEPLRNITNYAALLEKGAANNAGEETRYFLAIIKKSADKMKLLISDILLLSLVGKNRIVEKVDCNDALNKVLADMHFSIGESNAIIKADRLPVIESNPREISQLLKNLLSNALKFKAKNATPEIQIHCFEKHSEWEFAVSDNGIGIEEVYLKKIFLVFQRLHSEAEYPGTGMGLAICKKIVDANGGKIWVSSKPGVGSVFHFTLPKTKSQTE